MNSSYKNEFLRKKALKNKGRNPLNFSIKILRIYVYQILKLRYNYA